MKKITYLIVAGILTIVLVNCEKSEIDNLQEMESKQTANLPDDNRIEFLKSANSNESNYANQQPFTLHEANQVNKTDIAFIVEYLAGSEYKLHEFDFIWDEKLIPEGSEKIWMNLNVYHKTVEANANNTVYDSTYVSINELNNLPAETQAKLWLRFKNTTKEDNQVEIQYNAKIEEQSTSDTNTGANGSSSTSTSNTGGNNGNTPVTTQDSTYNTTSDNSGTTTNTGGNNSNTPVTTQDSTYNTSSDTGGTTTTTGGTNETTNVPPQDSTQQNN